MSTKRCKCRFCGKVLIRRSAPSIKSKMHFCNIACKSGFQRTAKPVDKAWLWEHYVTQGMDCTHIAHIVKRDPKSVWNWLKDLGIPTRPRGSVDNGHQHRAGQPSSFKGKKHTPGTKAKLRAIAIADGRVPYDPAVGSYMKGKRGAQVPSWKGGITPERQAFYSTPAWKAVVKLVWKRDNATCQKCGRRNVKGLRYVFDIHHIVGFHVKNLRAVLSNLVLLCEDCHYWVHSKENVNHEFVRDI